MNINKKHPLYQHLYSIIQFTLLMLLLTVVVSFNNEVWAAADPLLKVNSNVKSAVSTLQLVALTIAGAGLIFTLLAGMFTQLNKGQLLQILAIIIGIAGAVMIIDWIAGWVK